MMTVKRSISAADIQPAAEYAAARAQARARMAQLKRDRRVEVGPIATFYFENWETVRHQIQEMLHIEKGGAEQLADEIAAYAPLIPRGDDLIATVMIEIEDPARRRTMLARLGHIENHVFLRLGDALIRGEPDPTRENTSPDGKASAVQFIRFPLGELAAGFKHGVSQVQLGFDHPNYGHIAVVPESVRASLAGDLE